MESGTCRKYTSIGKPTNNINKLEKKWDVFSILMSVFDPKASKLECSFSR